MKNKQQKGGENPSDPIYTNPIKNLLIVGVPQMGV